MGTGRGTPDISLLLPLSKELGVTVSKLLKGSTDKSIKVVINYIDTSNKNKFIIPIAIIIYVITLLLYLWYLKVEYSNSIIQHSYIGEIVYTIFFSICIITTNSLISNYYYDKLEDKEKIKRVSYVVILILYTITLLNMTLFGKKLYGVVTYNLIPFKTLIEYLVFL